MGAWSTCIIFIVTAFRTAAQPYPFNNASLSPSNRAADLLGRLTLAEKVGMLYMDASMAFGNDSLPVGGDLPSTEVKRLGVPQFIWMGQGSVYRGAANGCNLGCCTACPNGLAGCCHDGVSTQLPQGTGLAATFNDVLAFRAGVMVSDESLGIQNGYPGGSSQRLVDYRTGASNVINILRDGRWGRAPETLGECPSLTGAIAVAFNKGLAGYATLASTTREYGEYMKVIPVLRHFVAYAGPDAGRFSFNAVVSEDDLLLTYLPAWRALSASGALGGVMSAISALNSIPSAAHRSLLTGILRNEWGFDGYVISDCDTIAQVSTSFHYAATVEQAAVSALRAGGDLNCGPEYAILLNATRHGLAAEAADIDPAVRRLLVRRVQSGDLDLPVGGPYSYINYSVVDSPEHRALARQVVRESVVLLRNDGGALPLRIRPGDSSLIRSLLVVGPSADDPAIQAHTYHGTPREWVTILSGIRAVADTSINVTYVRGCGITGGDTSGFAAALAAAAAADAVVYVGGLEAALEEEDTDRADFALPGVQLSLIQQLHGVTSARSIPLVVTIVSGGPVSEPWLVSAAANGTVAWVWLSYFGQDGGGVADVLAGAYSPSGRLPFTIPVDTSQVGPITDYDMRSPPFGRTYRYLRFGTTEDGFTVLDGVEVACLGACLVGAPSCDSTSVPGQCSWPRATAAAQCGAWAACAAVNCNHGRSDCQARAFGDPQQPSSTFTSLVRGVAQPLFPFAYGLSYAAISVTSFTLAAPVARLGDIVTVNVSVANGPAGPSADYAVAVFGSFMACDGTASPVAATPLRSLLAFTKAQVPSGMTVHAVLNVSLTSLAIPGVERQPMPGRVKIWVGDGSPCTDCPSSTLELALGDTTCANLSFAAPHSEL